MKSQFLLQPYEEEGSAEETLRAALRSGSYTEFLVASAWVRRSGLRLIERELRQFLSSGGSATLITGVSMTGATVQGLEFAAELFDSAYIFYQERRTFHPKIALLTGLDDALVLVGSSNFTVGGLVENWEANVLIRLDPRDKNDQDELARLVSYFARLISDTNACKRLDGNLLKRLIADPRYQLGDEDSPRTNSPTALGILAEPIFTPSIASLRRAHFGSREDADKQSVNSPMKKELKAPASTSVVLRWSKKLPRADAQRLIGSSPSNTVALTQALARGQIDQATWFRDELFSNAQWRDLGQYESAIIHFEAQVHGRILGDVALEVRQTPRFTSRQGNRAASLHWSGALAEEVSAHDLSGDYISIELISDGNFRLTISAQPIGRIII